MGVRESQRLRDPVCGLIVFGGGSDAHMRETDRIAWKLINTREFQRLRRIRQLGFSELVFPGATHSRFAHCVGVYYTARGIMDVIRRRQGDAFDPDRARVALLAALLHDVGHGPFSHVFEKVSRVVGLHKRHEDWSGDIIEGETAVNGILREFDEQLPKDVAAMLKEEQPKDIYATVVSSQLDADRLDYIQRDRLMTGVQFGHVDRDWLFDCMEVGQVTVEAETGDDSAGIMVHPCLYLNHKGIQVGEEYLEARLRMYTMVYMHKTTRAAEMMLGKLLHTASQSEEDLLPDPLRSYFASSSVPPSLQLYLSLDDYTIWALLNSLQSCANARVNGLATRILNRDLYKCFDLGPLPKDGNWHLRFFGKVKERFGEDESDFLRDDHTVQLYKGYNFDDRDALNKIFVKPQPADDEPQDIVSVSRTVQALLDETRSSRLYAPDSTNFPELENILKEVKG